MRTSIRTILLSILVSSTSSIASTIPTESPLLKTYLDKFLTVSCDKTGNRCLAVGFGNDSQLSNRLVYKTEDAGKTWSEPFTLSAPQNENSSSEEVTSPHPASISCDAYGQRCSIVSAALLDNIPTPIVYNTIDSGLTWSEPTVLPLPTFANLKLNFNYPSAITTKISCDYSAYTCVIAGTLWGDNELTPLLYVTHNGGRQWTVINSLKLVSSTPKSIIHGSYLSDVNCDNSGYFCTVVGSAITKNSYWSNYYSSKPLVYSTQDGGVHWSKPQILPTEITDEKASTLTAVACNDLGNQCTAVGFTRNVQTNQYEQFSFTSTSAGKDWEKGNLITSNKVGADFNSIHCDDTGNNCTAVGWYNSASRTIPVFKPLIYSTNDGAKTWVKNSQLSFKPLSELKDIFCSATGESCIAVGTQADLSMTLRTSQKMPGSFSPLQTRLLKPVYFVTPQ